MSTYKLLYLFLLIFIFSDAKEELKKNKDANSSLGFQSSSQKAEEVFSIKNGQIRKSEPLNTNSKETVRHSMSERLWDREPTLWQMAQKSTIQQTLPRQPQIAVCFPATSEPAVDLCTRKLRISLWGPPEKLTMTLGKSDVWDRRRAWVTPVTLGQIWSGAFAECNEGRLIGESGKYLHPQGGYYSPYSYRAGWSAYTFPSHKQVGQTILLCPEFGDLSAPIADISCDDGTAFVMLRHDGAELGVTILPMMTRNVIAMRLQAKGLTQAMAVRLYRHQDVSEFYLKKLPDYDYAADAEWNGLIEPPESGTEGRFFWIRQRFPAEKTFPSGFEYVLVGLAPNKLPVIETVENQQGLGTPMDDSSLSNKLFGGVTYTAENNAPGAAATLMLPKKSADCTVIFCVVTTAEAKDPLAEAQRRLYEAELLGFEGLRRENLDWYHTLYDHREQGRIFVGDQNLTRKRIPDFMKSWRVPDDAQSQSWPTYPDPRAFEGDEVYPAMGSDRTMWHDAPCYNEIYTTAVSVLNQNDRLEYFVNLVDHWLEAARLNAQNVFGLPGMFLAHGYHPPIKADTYTHIGTAWEMCMEIPAQVLKPLWDVWDYGGDQEYLEKRVYPALRDLADFYAAYVSKGKDGYYHVIPSVSAEHWGITYRFARNRDATAAVAMVRWTLQRAAETSELLDRDAERRKHWQTIAKEIVPYPTFDTDDGKVLTDVTDVNPIGVLYNFFGGVTPTVLADQINLDSPLAEKTMMIRTAQSISGWRNRDVYHLLGVYPEIRKGAMTSMHIEAIPDKPINAVEKLLDVTSEEPERLLNSRSGRIHLFPCVPPNSTVAFRDFQARGGFLVSAEMIDGKVTFVEITARRSVSCHIMNPWPGREMMIFELENRRIIEHKIDTLNSECLEFTAVKGRSYGVSRTN